MSKRRDDIPIEGKQRFGIMLWILPSKWIRLKLHLVRKRCTLAQWLEKQIDRELEEQEHVLLRAAADDARRFDDKENRTRLIEAATRKENAKANAVGSARGNAR